MCSITGVGERLHKVFGQIDVRSTIASHWTTSLSASDDLTKTKGPNNTLKLNYFSILLYIGEHLV